MAYSAFVHPLAAEAVTVAVGRPISEAASDPKVIEICAKLSDSEEDKVRARANFYATADTERIRYYVHQDSQELSASQLVALLTDLPPLWIFDCYTNRKGSIPLDSVIAIGVRRSSVRRDNRPRWRRSGMTKRGVPRASLVMNSRKSA